MKICCDIDGVLADVRPYLEEYLPHDWKTYFKHTSEFKPIKPIAELVRSWFFSDGRNLYLVTGRPESNRRDTFHWLETVVGIWPYRNLLMRPDNDPRSTWEIKLEWFQELQPDLIIDDDPEVVEAATKEGFIVLQVYGFRGTDNDMIPENYLEETECTKKS